MSDLGPRQPSDELGSADQDTPKRKRQENGPQQRSKRARYISIACNECKRRKIKCNGETPCQRCGNLNLECLYAPNCCTNNFRDAPEFKQMNAQIMSLQEQVDALWANLNALRNALGHDSGGPDPYAYDPTRSNTAPQASMVIDPALNKPKTSPQLSRFQGPTSSAYSFGVARSSLNHMGITSNDEDLSGGPNTRDGSPSRDAPTSPLGLHPRLKPLLMIRKEEGLRLCNVFEDEVGSMYPILDFDRLKKYATLVLGLSSRLPRTGPILPGVLDFLQDPDFEILRLVFASALVCEGNGRSELGRALFESVTTITENSLQSTVDIKRIQIITLMAMYHFLSDDEGLAWRIIGIAARLCIELGLHRSETYATLFPDEDERLVAIKVFWSVYVLDRRWSFGTGMSFALSDTDIDSSLPKPSEEIPYLSAMIGYCDIATKVWQSIASRKADPAHPALSKDTANYLEYQLLQWYQNLPKILKYTHPNSQSYLQYQAEHPNDPDSINAAGGRALHRLRALLYLRLNQMKILIYRPVLYALTPTMAADSGAVAESVVDTAKDSIQVLNKIAETSDLYQTQQVCFNHFLMSALAVLFLAVSHAPAHFAVSCRDEFYAALNVVRRLSPSSAVSKRLWRTIRSLKEIGPRLGVYAQGHDRTDLALLGTFEPGSTTETGGPVLKSMHNQEETQNDAAMAMARLSGRNIDENSFLGANGSTTQDAFTPASRDVTSIASASPNGIANDLMFFFEAAGNAGNGQMNFGAGNATANGSSDYREPSVATLQTSNTADGIGVAYGNDEEFSRIMRNLF